MPDAPLPLVLIVDDADDVLSAASLLLEGAGFRVTCASSGFAAVKLAFELNPDVILMDLAMPGMDGVETTRHLKRQEQTRHIPVIAFTGKVLVAQRDRLQARGFAGFVSKPCSPDEMADAVRRAIGQ
jgi:two-component system cell cycle response regulator DivK